MAKQVVIIASGETERRSLPHLVDHLVDEDIAVVEVRIPPRGRALTVDMAEKLLKASWYQKVSTPPDKFVIVVDTDGNSSQQALFVLREQLPNRIHPTIDVQIQFAYAQWHLEAWYFADSRKLRDYLGRDLGNVDASKPDEIQNPKLHLRNLLADRAYTAVTSEEIAISLDAETICQRSPSFQGFLEAIRNGQVDPENVGTAQ